MTRSCNHATFYLHGLTLTLERVYAYYWIIRINTATTHIVNTVESLLKDTPNKRKYLSTKDTFGCTKNGLSYGSI